MILRIPRPELEYEDWTVDGLDLDKASKYIKGIHASDSTISTENIDEVMQEFTNELIPGYRQEAVPEEQKMDKDTEELPGEPAEISPDNDVMQQTNE